MKFFSIVFLLFGCVYQLSGAVRSDLPEIRLDNSALKNNEVVVLKDNWGFAWEKLIDKHEDIPAHEHQIIRLDKSWTNYRLETGQPEKDGFATYYLKIVTDGSFQNPGLKIPFVNGAVKVIVNNKIYAELGEIGTDEGTNVPAFDSEILKLERSNDGIYHVIVQVANYHYSRSGMANAPAFGDYGLLKGHSNKNSMLVLFLFGAMITMTIILLGFYVYLKKLPLLYFGIFCLILAVRLITMGDMVIHDFVLVPWYWMVKIDYLTFYSGALFAILFAQSLFKDIIRKRIFQFIVFVFIIFNLLILFSKPVIFSFTTIPFEIYFVGISLYFLVGIGKRAWKGQFTARVFFVGIIAFYLVVINDILNSNNLVQTGDLFQVGIVILILSISLLLPLYFSDVFKKLDFLKTELCAQNNELKKVNGELDRLIYIVSHDLKSPLSSLQGLVNLARKEAEGESMKVILDLKEKSINNLKSFVDDILDYSRNTQTNFKPVNIDFNFLINELLDGILYQDGYNHVNISSNINQNEDFFSDLFRMRIIMNNLISNAFKFRDESKKEPKVNIQIKVNNGWALIEIKDNGIGIPESHLKNVFGMFFRVDNSKVDGTGLGLYLVNECVNSLNGKVSVNSTELEGTTFLLEIPSFGSDDTPNNNNPQKGNIKTFTSKVKKILIDQFA